jgi:hypothetical protein
MKIKIAVAAAILGCQLCALSACARGEADKRIDTLLLAPLSQIAQMDGAGVPNGLPYVPPDERQADGGGGASFERKASSRAKRGGSHKHGGKHKKRLGASRKHSTAAALGGQASEPESCCAPTPAQM